VIASEATRASALDPLTLTSPIVIDFAMKTRIDVVPWVTTSELTWMGSDPPSVIWPVSVSMCEPDGSCTLGSLAAATNAGPSPFVGAKLRQCVPSVAQPRTHAVMLCDVPPGSQVVSVSPAQDVAPGEQPQRSTGQSGGTIVQTFFVPPDAENSPFTSQKGYATSLQSESDVHLFCSFVGQPIAASTATASVPCIARRIHTLPGNIITRLLGSTLSFESTRLRYMPWLSAPRPAGCVGADVRINSRFFAGLPCIAAPG
jgi:hypothetical protein